MPARWSPDRSPLLFGLFSPTFTRLMLATPKEFVMMLGGLAMLRVLQGAFVSSFRDKFSLGALASFLRRSPTCPSSASAPPSGARRGMGRVATAGAGAVLVSVSTNEPHAEEAAKPPSRSIPRAAPLFATAPVPSSPRPAPRASADTCDCSSSAARA